MLCCTTFYKRNIRSLLFNILCPQTAGCEVEGILRGERDPKNSYEKNISESGVSVTKVELIRNGRGVILC